MLGFGLIFIGGGIGAVLRYLMSALAGRYLKVPYLGTFIVNIAGCLFLGFIMTLAIGHSDFIPPDLKLFLTTGIAGGFTTFSTFGFENIDLIKKKEYINSLLYMSSSFIFGILAIFAGYMLAGMV